MEARSFWLSRCSKTGRFVAVAEVSGRLLTSAWVGVNSTAEDVEAARSSEALELLCARISLLVGVVGLVTPKTEGGDWKLQFAQYKRGGLSSVRGVQKQGWLIEHWPTEDQWSIVFLFPPKLTIKHLVLGAVTSQATEPESFDVFWSLWIGVAFRGAGWVLGVTIWVSKDSSW